MAYTLTKAKRIFIDDKLIDNPRQEKRYRFTLAEELAHFIIHRDIYSDCETIEDRIEVESLLTRQEIWYLETNAKALASAILMPKTTFEARLNSLISDPRNITSLNTSVNILSHDFDVNPKAAERRLRNLGYYKSG